MMRKGITRGFVLACALGSSLIAVPHAAVAAPGKAVAKGPKFSKAVAFDVSRPLREIAPPLVRKLPPLVDGEFVRNVRPETGPEAAADKGFTGDGALFPSAQSMMSAAVSGPLVSFEGLSNQDNFNFLGGRVNPPDPVGDVGPNHYVEMINLVYAVYDKRGNLLSGPNVLGDLWQGYPIADCSRDDGDPIVVYDQLEDRWILSQFTANFAAGTFYNCVAVSVTGDPTGAYYRYAFVTQPDPEFQGGTFFPDYPKYGVWTHSYILTTRDFGAFTGYGISIYALEKRKMIAGNPDARAVQFFLDSSLVPLELMGDGLLPPDIDGTRRPQDHVPVPIVGTQDDGAGYGATRDALNIWELSVRWNATPDASLDLAAQLPVAPFDSIFPCGTVPGLPPNQSNSRDCLPQPGVTDGSRFLDVLSYRQRPTYRLAYRNFGTYEALVATQSVEAKAGIAGMRWYEIRRTADKPRPNSPSQYTVHQQGTFSPDNVHRWMGSVAMDWKGNIALGYSVVDGTSVFPGIRYTGRLAGDPAGQMTLGEGTIISGTGVQRTTNSRWGDYTSLNVDPTDDCTFWYVNQYYTLAGQNLSTAGWQTRIGAFKLPGCAARQ